jgi:hypothetical protein
MENVEKRQSVMDGKLKRLFFYYGISGCFFLLVFSSSMLLNRYDNSLHDTLDNLRGLKIGFIKIKDATADMKRSIAAIRNVIPVSLGEISGDRLLLMALDSVKTRMKNDEITISTLSYKENEVVLPVTIKGQLDDYPAFVNHVGYLQAMKFPFFYVNSVVLKKSDEPGLQPVLYEITGELKLPRAAGGEGKAGQKSGAP